MLVDVSHVVEHGMITYRGLPAPLICDFLSREQSRAHYAPGTEFQITPRALRCTTKLPGKGSRRAVAGRCPGQATTHASCNSLAQHHGPVQLRLVRAGAAAGPVDGHPGRAARRPQAEVQRQVVLAAASRSRLHLAGEGLAAG